MERRERLVEPPRIAALAAGNERGRLGGGSGCDQEAAPDDAGERKRASGAPCVDCDGDAGPDPSGRGWQGLRHGRQRVLVCEAPDACTRGGPVLPSNPRGCRCVHSVGNSTDP